MNYWREFHGPNAGYIEELYNRYRQNPESVDAATRRYFEQAGPPPDELAGADGFIEPGSTLKIVGAVNLAQSVRQYGHLAAQLDPLGSRPPGEPSLEAAYHNLDENDLRALPAGLIGGPLAAASANAWQAIAHLRQIYAATTGYDYDHLRQVGYRSRYRCGRTRFGRAAD
jgi:2-oxoglutarate dehydrogenase E1 component